MKVLKNKGFIAILVLLIIALVSFTFYTKKVSNDTSKKDSLKVEAKTTENSGDEESKNVTQNTTDEKETNKNRFEGIKTTTENINIPILCYHDVTPNNPDNNDLLVNPEKFKEQLQYLKDNNYTPISLDEFYDYLRKNQPIPEKSVVITFDDGYKGNYEYAYPLLKEFKFPATVFVISNYVGAPDFMTVEQLKEMSDNGIEIESHTFKHDDLSKLDETQQLETLKNSKNDLEKIIGKPIDFIAYPFGRHNSSTRIAAEKAGYKLGFNLNGNFADRKDNNFNIDRIYVSNNDSLKKFESRLTGK